MERKSHSKKVKGTEELGQEINDLYSGKQTNYQYFPATKKEESANARDAAFVRTILEFFNSNHNTDRQFHQLVKPI